MTTRQLGLQVNALIRHTIDNQGRLQPKMVKAIFAAVAESKWPHKRVLLRQFVSEIARLERQQRAVVVSAQALVEAEQQQIEEMVHSHYPGVATIDWQRQPDLLAGVSLQVGDTWYDLSVKQRLTQIQEHLA
jgi:F0F1-type ATP synthase delta subunit